MNKEDVNKIWAVYFEELLNVEDDWLACISAVPNGKRIPVCWKCNEESGQDECNWGC